MCCRSGTELFEKTGARLADLPVQAPTKYGLVINLKIAKVVDLDLPPSVLAHADVVIE
jgi:putative ABC transport system substrate-binding protein